MGSFIFKWTHPATEVYVTGTFDDWSKSEKLVKSGSVFEKDVTLPSAEEKIYYKFVVDGNWVTDHTAPQENDASGNLNNVLTTDRISKHTPSTVGIMSSADPTSTTADLAKGVPLENNRSTGSSDLPGSFPETPAAVEKEDFGVNPLPAADGAVNPIKLEPGEPVPHPSTFTTHTITSGIHDDPELVAADRKEESESTFRVAPLPAFAGAVNPVTVAPGQELPDADSVTANTLGSAITTDKESYEKSGGLGHAPILPPVITPETEREEKGTGILDLPPISKTMIPESSLPMQSSDKGIDDVAPTVQSAGPQSTTAQLAAAVPLESSAVPDVVKESQKEAGVEPEASSVPNEVQEKSAVEKELLEEVPVAPSTSEGTVGKGTEKREQGVTAAEAAAAVGGAAVALGGAAVTYASGAASKIPSTVTNTLPTTVQASMNSEASPHSDATAKATPGIVKESIAEAGQTPEAASNQAAVLEKRAVERELLSEITQENSSGEPAPQVALPEMSATAETTPEIVKESIAEAGQSPEAASNETAVREKKAVEKELLSEITQENSTGRSAPEVAATDNLGAPTKEVESRDVSPGTIPGSHAQTTPLVTTGVQSSATAPVTPAKGAASSSKLPDSPANSSAADKSDKKKKRSSGFFGKLKAKLSDKKKE